MVRGGAVRTVGADTPVRAPAPLRAGAHVGRGVVVEGLAQTQGVRCWTVKWRRHPLRRAELRLTTYDLATDPAFWLLVSAYCGVGMNFSMSQSGRLKPPGMAETSNVQRPISTRRDSKANTTTSTISPGSPSGATPNYNKAFRFLAVGDFGKCLLG